MSGLPKPICLYQNNYTTDDLAKLKKNPIWHIVDIFVMQLGELFDINHPELRMTSDYQAVKEAFIDEQSGAEPDLKGNWLYFPWSGSLIHTVNSESYHRLRTNRNQLLITIEEQQKLSSYRVGVTGLSVGNSIAISLAYSGVNRFKLAEFDTLETANLNRLRSGIHKLGQPKLDVTMQQLYEINPYAEIEAWPNGLHAGDVRTFFTGERPLNAVFDEIDDFEMKIRLRIAAKAAKIPVIMLTSLGDSILVDVERYDLDNDLQLFNGLLGDLPEEVLRTKIGEKEKVKYAMQIVGSGYIPTRALASLLQINQTLVGRPQLYGTIAVDGGLATYLVRRLALGLSLPSGRSHVAFDKILQLSPINDEGRKDILGQLNKVIE